jgi:hypothetical protein
MDNTILNQKLGKAMERRAIDYGKINTARGSAIDAVRRKVGRFRDLEEELIRDNEGLKTLATIGIPRRKDGRPNLEQLPMDVIKYSIGDFIKPTGLRDATMEQVANEADDAMTRISRKTDTIKDDMKALKYRAPLATAFIGGQKKE